MVTRRRRIGLLFGLDENWIGGGYYIMNLVRALNMLPDNNKPHIVFLSDKRNINLINNLKYPYYSIHNPYKSKRNYAEAAMNKILKLLLKKDIIDKRLTDNDISVLFPATNDTIFNKISNKIFWIPDFQHHQYPALFSQEELVLRNENFQKIAQSNQTLVLSSQSAYKDFKQFYPDAQVKTEVIPFAVTHPDFSEENSSKLMQKYEITKPYYIVTNQFWQHKNHAVVFKALIYLLEQSDEINFEIVLTGKADDFRAPNFYNELISYVKENKLEPYLKFLGFIPRTEQLKLMQNAKAIIQPSIFEGWSTVVEDAKALNKFILLSDIAVHIEQSPENAEYFKPGDATQLAEQMKKFALTKTTEKPYNYNNNIKQYAANLQNLFSSKYA